MNIEICLGNSHDNFQLHRFTTSENIAKSFRGATFLTHTVQPAQLLQFTKINATLTLSRVESAPHREDVTAVVSIRPARKESPSTNTKLQWRPPPDSCCRHNSSVTAATIATATPISQMKRSRVTTRSQITRYTDCSLRMQRSSLDSL